MSGPADRKVSENLQRIAKSLAAELEDMAGERVGFSLLVFQTDADSRSSYVSNCRREEVVEAMEVLLNSWKTGMPDIPVHEFQS